MGYKAEVDRYLRVMWPIRTHFNSRPHEEVDDLSYITWYNLYIFQLTTSRRGRPIWGNLYGLNNIFQLTTSRRGRPSSTASWAATSRYFNSRPHEEVDVYCCAIWTNIGIFQLTTSRRGRRIRRRRKLLYNRISTHDLTKRSTRLLPSCASTDPISTHDLTKRSTRSRFSSCL